jgi:hypothetical protein
MDLVSAFKARVSLKHFHDVFAVSLTLFWEDYFGIHQQHPMNIGQSDHLKFTEGSRTEISMLVSMFILHPRSTTYCCILVVSRTPPGPASFGRRTKALKALDRLEDNGQ